MAKTVKSLKAKKHRKWIWADSEGALWYWEPKRFGLGNWCTLLPNHDGWDNDITVENDDPGKPWPSGPFTRVYRNPYWGDKSVVWEDFPAAQPVYDEANDAFFWPQPQIPPLRIMGAQ